jgi:hypothetical protein
MIITRNEIDEFKDINFHYAEIAKIICDYDTGTIEMPIVMDEKQRYNAILRFENILSLEVSRKEPWGPGKYVFALNIEVTINDFLKVNIVLNSGDEINIIAAKIIYLPEI